MTLFGPSKAKESLKKKSPFVLPLKVMCMGPVCSKALVDKTSQLANLATTDTRGTLLNVCW